MSPTALLALRDPGEGKTRLGVVLSPAERAEIARAMALDVVDALRESADVVVVAEGPRAAGFGRELGLRVLRDRRGSGGLNAAFGDAVRAVGRSRPVLLVCADLPGLLPQDVRDVVAADAEVVVAPTRDGGTGGLLLRAGARIDLAYGVGSAAAHRQGAGRSGLRAVEVASPGFAHDVDDPVDLWQAATRWPDSHTGRAVSRWGVVAAAEG